MCPYNVCRAWNYGFLHVSQLISRPLAPNRLEKKKEALNSVYYKLYKLLVSYRKFFSVSLLVYNVNLSYFQHWFSLVQVNAVIQADMCIGFLKSCAVHMKFTLPLTTSPRTLNSSLTVCSHTIHSRRKNKGMPRMFPQFAPSLPAPALCTFVKSAAGLRW